MTRPHRYATLPVMMGVLLAGIGCNNGADPALKAVVENLEREQRETKASLDKLKEQVKALEGKGDAGDRGEGPQDPVLGFARATAASFLDAVLAGDGFTARKSIGDELGKRIAPNWFGVNTDVYNKRLEEWALAWNADGRYQTYRITSATLSPNKDKVILQGTLSGKQAKDAFLIHLEVSEMGKRFGITTFLIRPQ